MIVLKREDVRARLPWPDLIEAIRQRLAEQEIIGPQRLAFDMEGGSQGGGGTLLVMPGWHGSQVLGVKIVTFWPDNGDHGLASHGANYLLMDARSAEILASLDGEELTQRRTGAVSALAARFLLRPDASTLLVLGTGPVAEQLVEAHQASGRFSLIEVYGRTAARAAAMVERLNAKGVKCRLSENLERSVRAADMIVTATSSSSPLFDGSWMRPGVHLDLVGGFRPNMREIDDAAIKRATAVWIDTPAAIVEAGDLTQPIATGLLAPEDIAGDLRSLVTAPPTRGPGDITIFKAVGFALPDLAAAQLALDAELPSVRRVG